MMTSTMRARGIAMGLFGLLLPACRLDPPQAGDYLPTSGTEGSGTTDPPGTPSPSSSSDADTEMGSGAMGTGSDACGDGVVDPGEDCDDGGESATCNADCTPAQCGDDRANAAAAESCDGSDLLGEDCVTLGQGGGTLACLPDCSGFDLSGCSACGNDIIDDAETCDGDDLNGEDCLSRGFEYGTLGCLPDCSDYDISGCGDFGGACCASNDTPGCDDMGCTTAVCAADPSCCRAAWSQGCADLAFSECPAICDNCGDGTINSPVEVCDGADVGMDDCSTQGFDGGVLACQPDCAAFDTAGCINFTGDCCNANGTPGCADAPCAAMVCASDAACCNNQWSQACADAAFALCPAVCDNCGDDLINSPVEVCDGAALMGETCISQGFDTGTLGCQPDCSAFDTSGCVNYGGDCCSDNGTPGCDDDVCTADVCAADPACCNAQWDQSCADATFTLCPAVCDNCGDGLVNSPVEECDDAGESATCDDDCTLPVCGDGLTNVTAGEDCDDAGESPTCDVDCTLPVCGDGLTNTNAGEQCDDGNLNNDDGCDDQCMNELHPNVLRCGGSSRDVTSFFPPMSGLNLVIGCTPDMDTQAVIITRTGTNLYNPAEISAYVSGGGIVLTEFSSSDDVFSDLFANVAEGAFTGSCQDRAPIVFQYNAGDPFWLDNPFNPIPLGDSGCGRDVSAFPGITPLVGWNNATVSIAYRDLGTGRMWITDFDWQDLEIPEIDPSYADTNSLMGYMITHGQ
ncbi:MAG: hypothetical protein AAGF11_07380 [Myxococcota bacterium]